MQKVVSQIDKLTAKENSLAAKKAKPLKAADASPGNHSSSLTKKKCVQEESRKRPEVDDKHRAKLAVPQRVPKAKPSSRRARVSHETFKNSFNVETFQNLVLDEEYYRPDPYYLELCKPSIKWEMRAILVDWLIEVCENYFFKRETLHYSVNYIDRYLCAVPHVPTSELQLVGVTALFIAAKMDEIYTPKIESIVTVTNNTYSAARIRVFELEMAQRLEMKLTPPTLNMWAVHFATEWDRFLDSNVPPTSSPQQPPSHRNSNPPNVFAVSNRQRRRQPEMKSFARTVESLRPQFKAPNEESYRLFRELFQIVDLCLLDVQSLQYNQRGLVLAVMYLVIGKKLEQF